MVIDNSFFAVKIEILFRYMGTGICPHMGFRATKEWNQRNLHRYPCACASRVP